MTTDIMDARLIVFALLVANLSCCHGDVSTFQNAGTEFRGKTENFNSFTINKYQEIPYSEKISSEWLLEKSSFKGQIGCKKEKKDDCLFLNLLLVGDADYNLKRSVIILFGQNSDAYITELVEKRKCTFYGCANLAIILLNPMSNIKKLSRVNILAAINWAKQNKVAIGYDGNDATIVSSDEDSSKLLMEMSMFEDKELFQAAVISYANVLPNVDPNDIPDNLPQRRYLLGVGEDFCNADRNAETLSYLAFIKNKLQVTLYERNDKLVDERGLWIQYAVIKDKEAFAPSTFENNEAVIRVLRLPKSWHKFAEYVPKLQTCDSILPINHPYLGPYVPDVISVNITTKMGPVIGRHVVRGVYQGQTLNGDSFFHVPYGKKPIRFEHSKISEGWTDVLDARYALKSKECPQKIGIRFGQEDCLNLNIYVPGNLTDLLNAGTFLPVMTFFHGGSFELGTAAGFNIGDNHIYDGTILSNIGQVIVVSVSYRLGALGFMNDGKDNGILEGNYGIRDMILSLEWIRDNIADYAGDGNDVTIFGQSAGAAAVSVIGLSPMSQGLIKGVIGESGSAMTFFSYHAHPEIVAKPAIEHLGCVSNDPDLQIACLRKRNALEFPNMDLGYTLEWRPTIDDVFLPDTPENLFKNNSKNFNLMTGWNSDDTYIMASVSFRALLTAENISIEGLSIAGELLPQLEADYPEKQKYLSPVVGHSSLDWFPGQDTTQAEIYLNRVATDYAFAEPALQSLTLHAENADGKTTFGYLFDIKSRFPFFFPEWVKNSHAFELAFVFGEPLRIENFFQQDAKDLSVQMMTYWSNFAKSGNPNGPVTTNIDSIEWTPFTPADQEINVLDFNMTSDNMINQYRPYEIALWSNLVPELKAQDEEDIQRCTNLMEDSATSQKSLKENNLSTAWLNKIRAEVENDSPETFAFSGDGECDLTDPLIKQTLDGCVRGIQTTYNSINVEAYLGVPYAEPPIGNRRFMEPSFLLSSSQWTGALDTTQFRPDCPRDVSMVGQDEDCLYLNIYRPSNGQTNLPVMVWFHPDINSGNGGSLYEGYRMAAQGKMIVVTFNYRIGALGFLSTGSMGVRGNLGLLDQVLALYWVRRNIGNFGGNRDSVTIFGDSDSSEIIGYHTASIVSEGLFQKVIHQSGAGELKNNLPINAFSDAQRIAEQVGCDNTTDEILITECLQNTAVSDLLNAQITTNYKATVVIDGVVILDQPSNTLSETRIQSYSFLIGLTSGEGSSAYQLASAQITSNDVNTGIEEFKQFSSISVNPDGSYTNTRRIRSITDYEYLDNSYENSSADLPLERQQSALNMYGDKYYVAPSFHIANKSSLAGAPTYIFELVSAFESETPLYPTWVGVPHGTIARYIWYDSLTNPTSNDAVFADQLLQYYASFALIGVPGDIGSGWEPYTSTTWYYNKLSSASPTLVEATSYQRLKYVSLWNVLVPNVDYLISCEDLSLPPPDEIYIKPSTGSINPVRISGYVEKTSDGIIVDVFRGIPFAQPTTGDQRFLSSKPASPIKVSREFTLQKPYCIETVSGMDGGWASEDCLYLDIWRPRVTRFIGNLPTLVWYCNGGMNTKGQHNQIEDDQTCRVDGSLMAAQGEIILVKVHYRTGVFGFSGMPGKIEDNAGLTDALNAVDWVLENIPTFGGSSSNINVGGNGLGATLAFLVASRSSTRFFNINKVIAHSGALLSPWSYQPHPEDVFNSVANRLQCGEQDQLECLRAADAVSLATAASNVQQVFPFGLYVKSIDESSFSEMNLDDLKINGESLSETLAINQDKGLMIGMNTADGFDFTLEQYPEIKFVVNPRPLGNSLIKQMVEEDIYLSNSITKRNFDASELLSVSYTPSGVHTVDDLRRSAIHFHTDEGFVRPMYQEIMAKNSAYVYINYGALPKQTRRFNIGVDSWQTLGASFGEDLDMIFSSEDGLSSDLRSAWGKFLGVTGQPTPFFSNRWSDYNTSQTILYLSGGTVQRTLGFRDDKYYLWDSVVPTFGDVCPTPTLSTSTTQIVTTTKATTVPTAPMKTTTKTTKPPIVITQIPETCPIMPPLGTGIGLSLSAEEADTTIEVLFGLALSFACIIVILIGIGIHMKKSLVKGVTSMVMSTSSGNENEVEVLKNINTEGNTGSAF